MPVGIRVGALLTGASVQRPGAIKANGQAHPPARPTIGEPFNPWRERCGFYPPDVVARQRDLTDGQKRLYERGVRWAGQNAKFWHSFETMAEALGKSVRQVKADMAVLERKRFIAHERRGKRQSNIYRLLWHSCFEVEAPPDTHSGSGNVPAETQSEVQSTALHPQDGALQDLSAEVQPTAPHLARHEVQGSPSDVQSTAPGEVQSAAQEFSKLNLEKGISSSCSPVELIALSCPGETADDDHHFSNLNSDELASPEFLEEARKALHALATRDVLGESHPERFGPPDLAITAEIVEPWRKHGLLAWVDWLYFVDERNLGAKRKGVGYALFRSDSLACAAHWTPERMLSSSMLFNKMMNDRRRNLTGEHTDLQAGCSRCNHRGYFGTCSEELIDGDQIRAFFAHRCFCPKGKSLSDEILHAAEDQMAACCEASGVHAMAYYKFRTG